MKIGYIGLGNMGGALAERLLKSHPLTVYDVNPTAIARMEALGATEAISAAALASSCEAILMCLPKSVHVHTVLFGAGGIMETAKPGTLVIDQTTGEPEMTRRMASELAKAGVDLVDAPVSGGPRGAQAGQIAIMVGASFDLFQQAQSVLEAISPNIFHAGDVGAGQVIKIANNLLHHAQRLLSLEIFSLAAKNGIDPARAVDIILAGSGRNYFIEHNMHPRILAGKLQSGFTLDLLMKDVRLATDLGMNSGVPMPISNLVRELYQMHLNDLGGMTQVNTVVRTVDRQAGTYLLPTA